MADGKEGEKISFLLDLFRSIANEVAPWLQYCIDENRYPEKEINKLLEEDKLSCAVRASPKQVQGKEE